MRHPQRRPAPLRFTTFWKRYIGYGIAYGLLLLVIGGAVAFGIYALALSTNNTDTRDRIRYEKALSSYGAEAHDNSPATVQKRKAAAQKIVDAQTLAQQFGYGDTTFTDRERGKIQAVALTGQPLKLNTHLWSYTTYAKKVYGASGLVWMWWLLGWFAICFYYSTRKERGEKFRIADLPWKRVWPYFVTFALGPAAWGVFGVSAILLRIDQRQRVTQEARLPQVVLAPAQVTPQEGGREAQPLSEHKPPKNSYSHAPVAAKALYIRQRVSTAAAHRKRKQRQLQAQLENEQDEIRQIGADLRERQQFVNELRSDLQAIENSLDGEQAVVSTQTAAEEFDRIMRLPGVIAAQVVNDRLRLIVRAECPYLGQLYDLGDWRIDFGPDDMFIRAVCVRTGQHETWREGSYPSYRLGNGEFCFGDRIEIIGEHVAKGQYLEAMTLAVECLSTVNEVDQRHIPDAFKLLNKEKELHYGSANTH